MPVHPLKAWLFSEWWMPVASTGVSTSSVNISAGGAGHYHIVSDHSRPVENCADWTTRKSGAFSLLNSGTKPGLPGDHIRAMYDQIGKEEQIISPPYTRTPLDAAMRGRKKRKQGEDNALVG